jgi:hypothetical protein
LVFQGLDELFRVGSELKDLLLKDLVLMHDRFKALVDAINVILGLSRFEHGVLLVHDFEGTVLL